MHIAHNYHEIFFFILLLFALFICLFGMCICTGIILSRPLPKVFSFVLTKTNLCFFNSYVVVNLFLKILFLFSIVFRSHSPVRYLFRFCCAATISNTIGISACSIKMITIVSVKHIHYTRFGECGSWCLYVSKNKNKQ